MVRRPRNGYDIHNVEEIVLRRFKAQGYSVSRAEEGGLLLLHRPESRALLRFLWGRSQWDEEEVAALHQRMEILKADQGFLVSNGLFTEEARQRASVLEVALTDGAELRDLLYSTAFRIYGPGARQEEPPLPFAKYIPWFVGVSLTLLTVVVLLLVFIALAGVEAASS